MTAQPQPPPAAVRALLRHFRAQRPLRAGSLIVTIFGDAIAPRGGAVTLGSLIRLAAPFGITERLVRTSVARLARQGWLTAHRSGRRSEYRLTRAGGRRFAEATQRIYGAAPDHWDGRWTLLLLPPGKSRPLRLREDLRWLGFGQLSPTLFAQPACTLAEAREWLHGVNGGSDALIMYGAGADLKSDRRVAAAGWNLKALTRRYRLFVRRFAALDELSPEALASPETAFLVRTLLIHEYRKIHLQDPLLPPPLLPAEWVGAAAYQACRRVYARVFPAAETYLSQHARRLQLPLPAASPASQARFGGIARL
jgi:phenylacetic acid degradation operon negative regulatory protein